MSTTGVAPDTVTVSSTAPTRSSPLIVAVKFEMSSIFSRTTVPNPGNVNVSLYTPGRKSTMRYCPASSVMTVRTCSIKAGLAASTVTPGNTPPEASLTTPARALCASAVLAARNNSNEPTKTTTGIRRSIAGLQLN